MNANRTYPAKLERRAHPRRKVAASIEIREAATGLQMSAPITDLSRGGCFAETGDRLPVGTVAEVVVTKGKESFRAQAKVASENAKGMGLEFTNAGAEDFQLLGAWLDKSLQTQFLATGRQRGQRLPLRVSVRVSGYSAQGARFEEETCTSEINPMGASVLLAGAVKEGQRLVLSHQQTKVAIECMVVYSQAVSQNQFLVGIAFLAPSPRFWLVSFPPAKAPIAVPVQAAAPVVPQTAASSVAAAQALESIAIGQTQELCVA